MMPCFPACPPGRDANIKNLKITQDRIVANLKSAAELKIAVPIVIPELKGAKCTIRLYNPANDAEAYGECKTHVPCVVESEDEKKLGRLYCPVTFVFSNPQLVEIDWMGRHGKGKNLIALKQIISYQSIDEATKACLPANVYKAGDPAMVLFEDAKFYGRP